MNPIFYIAKWVQTFNKIKKRRRVNDKGHLDHLEQPVSGEHQKGLPIEVVVVVVGPLKSCLTMGSVLRRLSRALYEGDSNFGS